MISWQRLFPNLILVLILSFFLAGCVRPAPDPDTTAVSTEPDTSDPNVGGGTILDPTAVPNTDSPASPDDTIIEPETDAESYPASEEAHADAEETIAEAETVAEGYPASEETVADAEPATDEAEQAIEGAEEGAVIIAASDEEMTSEPPVEGTVEDTAEQSTETTSAECPKEHVVQPEENLFRIGLQYGLSWVTLAQYNGITNPNSITVGQTIMIPCETTSPPPIQPTPPPDNVTTYVVQPGDNLFRIGLKFGVSWVEIAEANGLASPNQIYTGQVLKIPTSVPGSRPEFTHVVQSGETVYSISVQYGIPAVAIAEANNLQEPYVIYTGQTLIIPGNG